MLAPPEARACYVFAHGAGAGMAHPFMARVAPSSPSRGIATLRYQFPYMEQGGKRPDAPKLAHATVRAAVPRPRGFLPALALFAGGKSFGGRMTSQAQAASPLPGVRGLAFLGFPLHPPGQPSDDARKHLFDVQVPMLFLQGTRDEFADLELITSVRSGLARAHRCACSRMPIIPFTCPRAPDARMPTSDASAGYARRLDARCGGPRRLITHSVRVRAQDRDHAVAFRRGAAQSARGLVEDHHF